MRHKGTKSFEFITRTGNIKLRGIYYHCGCGSSKSVSDIVSDGRKFSRQANELTSRYAASQSYQQASKYLRKDFGIGMSHEMLRTRVLDVSVQIKDIRDNDQGEHRWENLDGKRLYGYADGVLLNVRKEGWKECKLLRYECDGLELVRHRGLLGPIDKFGRMTRRETIQIGAKRCDEVVLLMDGAEGFHQHLQKNLPAARQIVDYWHGCQHIAECAELLYHDSEKRASKWRSRYCHLLRQQGAAVLISRLRKVRACLKGHKKIEHVDKLLRYLLSRAQRMDYKWLLDEGYRIDSGPIESSCKNVVQCRLKGCGMRWSRKGASAMLEVRCALMSDLWEDVIQKCA